MADGLTASLLIGFSDADMTDLHTATISSVWFDDPSGVLTQPVDTDALKSLVGATASGGSVAVAFSAEDFTDFGNLQTGEQVTLVYTVEIADGHDGVAQQRFVVTDLRRTKKVAVISDVTIVPAGSESYPRHQWRRRTRRHRRRRLYPARWMQRRSLATRSRPALGNDTIDFAGSVDGYYGIAYWTARRGRQPDRQHWR